MWIRRNKGTAAVIASLSLLLMGAVWFAYRGLVVGEGAVPRQFNVAMALGVFFSIVVGVGLMALVFYSSRKGYDEPPRFD